MPGEQGVQVRDRRHRGQRHLAAAQQPDNLPHVGEGPAAVLLQRGQGRPGRRRNGDRRAVLGLAEALKREFGKYYIDRIDLRAVRQIAFANADEIARKLLQLYEAGEFDVAHVVFNRFKSAMTQIVTVQQLIPPPRGEG